MKQGKQSFCVIKTDMSLSENTDVFTLISAKLKCQILFQDTSDATKIGLYHAVATEISESKKFLNSASYFFL